MMRYCPKEKKDVPTETCIRCDYGTGFWVDVDELHVNCDYEKWWVA